uniref:Uncharacterized protein n=1 Tax=Leersia perrieri TaxID=77586 RepID=A0A0D9XPR6_9ORYZ
MARSSFFSDERGGAVTLGRWRGECDRAAAGSTRGRWRGERDRAPSGAAAAQARAPANLGAVHLLRDPAEAAHWEERKTPKGLKEKAEAIDHEFMTTSRQLCLAY